MDSRGLFRETRAADPGLRTRVSDKVRGLYLVGSGRARVVEFSYDRALTVRDSLQPVKW